MKKLLVLMLVAGISSLASAGLVLNPSGTVDDGGMPVGIAVESTGAITGFEFKIEVVGGTIAGDLDWAGQTWMFAPYAKGRSDTHVEVTGGDFFAKAGPLTVLQGLTVTRTDPMAVVTLIATGNNNVDGGVVGKDTVMSTLTIVPEPMSLMMLGLGGLFLRRRK